MTPGVCVHCGDVLVLRRVGRDAFTGRPVFRLVSDLSGSAVCYLNKRNGHVAGGAA